MIGLAGRDRAKFSGPRFLLSLALALVCFAGCDGARQRKGLNTPTGEPPEQLPQPQPGVREPRNSGKPLPSVAAVVAKFNARAANIPRLWASHFSGVDFQECDASGRWRKRSEAFEGHLQYIQPRSVLMTFDKVGNTYAMLGSDASRYWWLELGDEPLATIGSHAAATPARIRQLGVPLAPEDLTRLLGFRPLADGAERESRLAWSSDGTSLVLTRTVGEVAESLWLDPETSEPSRIELALTNVDASGKPRIVRFAAELSKYESAEVGDVDLPGGPSARPRIPTRVLLSLWDGQTRVRIEFFTKEIKRARPKAAIFDLDRLLKTYRVKPAAIRDLDRDTPLETTERPELTNKRLLDLDAMWR
jgi:hypothetical protein